MPDNIALLLIGAQLATLALGLVIFHKSRRIHLLEFRLFERLDEQEQSIMNVYRQFQSFHGLSQQLKLNYPLPILRGWAASPDFLWVVADHLLNAKPTVIVECGSGASTIVAAQCLKLNGRGHVYSLENNAAYAEKTRKGLRRHGLETWATVIDAPLVKHPLGNDTWHWYGINEFPVALDAIDVIVVDGPPATIGSLARYPAGPILIPRLREGGVIFLDDTNRLDEREIIARWRDEFALDTVMEFDCEKGAVGMFKSKSKPN